MHDPTLVDEIRERFFRQGFAVVPGVLPPGVVSGLSSVVGPLTEAAWREGGAVSHDKINLEKVLICVPYLLQTLAEKLGPLLSALVGPRVYLEYEQVMVVHANSTYSTRRHRDVDGGREPWSEASLRHKGSVHLWIPLVDIDATRANMFVEPMDAPDRTLELMMQAGDALFLHNFVWHGSRANTSAQHRASWLLNFAPRPSRDNTNAGADLNLLLWMDGAPMDLGPEVCETAVLRSTAPLNLFDAYYTYDTLHGRMVNAANRGSSELPPWKR